MAKKLTVFCLLAIALFFAAGCFTSDQTHNRNHMRSIERDIDTIHIFFDRYFWNYDRDDPYKN